MDNSSWLARLFRIFPVAVLCVAWSASHSEAFHRGGVGNCSGCHSMHNGDSSPGKGNEGKFAILIASDPSSTCLSCHQKKGEVRTNGYLVSTSEENMPKGVPPAQLSPGGDFGWLKKSFRWIGEGGEASESQGERHGHNIVAADYRFVSDRSLVTSPGGTYPSASLTCISCHDPHGRYRRFADGSIGTSGAPILASGSYDSSPDPTDTDAVGVYRLLRGKGHNTSHDPGESFTTDPPAAVAPMDYNRTEEGSDTHVAYGAGMSEWCANCHRDYLVGTHQGTGHPAGSSARLSPTIVSNYKAYISSGNLSGNPEGAYTSMVPYEMGEYDYSMLKKIAGGKETGNSAPGTKSNVMCLTCHRAHASGWDRATRWNMKTGFLVYSGDYPGVEDPAVPSKVSQGRTRGETRRTFHERSPSKYAIYQRSLCNKCHAKD